MNKFKCYHVYPYLSLSKAVIAYQRNKDSACHLNMAPFFLHEKNCLHFNEAIFFLDSIFLFVFFFCTRSVYLKCQPLPPLYNKYPWLIFICSSSRNSSWKPSLIITLSVLCSCWYVRFPSVVSHITLRWDVSPTHMSFLRVKIISY